MGDEIPIKIVKSVAPPRPKWLAEQLPAPPWLGIIQGGVKSGKSNLITNLVLSSKFYRGYWDRIVLISPNAAQDESIKPIRDSRITEHYPEYSDDLIKMLEEQADHEETPDGEATLAHQKKKTLIILDDLVGDFSRGSAVSRLCMRYRQRNFSILITSQTFRGIPNTCRVNASWYIIFASHNEQELQKLEEEFPSFPKWRELYNEATSEPYSFLFMDIRRMLARKRFSKKPLWEK